MNTLFSSFLALLLLTPSARAGWQEVGNGGHVLICSSLIGSGGGSGRYFNMYDFIETQIRYNLTPEIPDVDPQSDQPLEILLASKMLDRIQGVDPSWLAEAHSLISQFYADARLMSGVDLVMVGDTGMGFIPRSCELKQLFLQSPAIGAEDRYYKVNADIWGGMFPEQKATGILHEVLYRLSPEARARFSSEKVRYVVALLLADQFQTKTMSEAQSILRDAGLLP